MREYLKLYSELISEGELCAEKCFCNKLDTRIKIILLKENTETLTKYIYSHKLLSPGVKLIFYFSNVSNNVEI